MRRKIFKIGHSLAVTLSKSILDELGLKEGSVVEIEHKNGQVVISKSKNKEQLDLGLKIRKKL